VSDPTTLRALADLPLQPVGLAESTLVIIDCQNTYTRGVLELEGVQAALDQPVVVCVNSSARGAFNLGYAPTVVAAATATRALPGLGDATVPAAAMQTASLAAMADLFVVVVPDTAAIPD
jgi:nicotinamidase-related amidase